MGAVAAVGAVFAIRSAVSRPAPLPDQNRPGTVLLVPGYGGGTGALSTLASALRASGRTVVIVQLPGDGTGDLNRQADALDAAAAKALHGDVRSVDVVGYSAGGVVARLWARDHDGTHRARRVVTIGAPHHGAELAGAGAALGGSGCPDGQRLGLWPRHRRGGSSSCGGWRGGLFGLHVAHHYAVSGKS